MNPKSPEPTGKLHELREKRKVLHGKRRQLHEGLSEVCEEFIQGDVTRAHKRLALVSELQYLLDYYKDDASWEGIS